MKITKIHAVCLFLVLVATASNANLLDITTDSTVDINQFAAKRLEQALAQHPQTKTMKLSLDCAHNPDPDCDDGYSLRKNENAFAIHAQNERGLMYGMLELASQLNQGRSLESIQEKAVQAHFPFRAIKFNLPWFSYRSGEHLALDTETCRDLIYWEAFLDMMVENKFNTLSLWNMHPYIYMVMPYQFEANFSWRKQLSLVERDIDLAGEDL